MPTDLKPPPLQQALVKYLKAAVNQRVATKVPRPRPDRFVIIELSGGPQRNLVQADPTILIQVWGSGDAETTKVDPWELTEQVWSALAATDEVEIDGVEVMKVGLTLPVYYPDEATGTPRYTFVYLPTVNLN